ncbi:hypothetical protein [Priestia megaterium]|uniref:hypothetical protein n=1 Tax=Priestia megaterium TaxID=1404 RepID=UPI000BFD370E|nr:hypothetical protein [Priestia megaterium]PGQ88159.1 hypothetical protein COA18_04345 [Priestia megaterium]
MKLPIVFYPLEWYFSKLAHLHGRMAESLADQQTISIEFVSLVGVSMIYLITPILLIAMAVAAVKHLEKSYDNATEEKKEWIVGTLCHIYAVGLTGASFLIHLYFFLPVILLSYITLAVLIIKARSRLAEKFERKSTVLATTGCIVAMGGTLTLLIMHLGSLLISGFN